MVSAWIKYIKIAVQEVTKKTGVVIHDHSDSSKMKKERDRRNTTTKYGKGFLEVDMRR